MAQKSNPISLRLEKTNKHHNSCWYGDYNYTSQLLKDCAISAHMENICQQAKIAPPVVFIHRGRQRVHTFFFFPPAPRDQQTLGKAGLKFASQQKQEEKKNTYKAPEQRGNWLGDFFLSYKKTRAHSFLRTPSQKENKNSRFPEQAATFSLGQEETPWHRIKGMTEEKSLFQYFLLSLLSSKNTLIKLDDPCEQNSSWLQSNRWLGHVFKKSSGKVALGGSNNTALVESRTNAQPFNCISVQKEPRQEQIWGTEEKEANIGKKTLLAEKTGRGTSLLSKLLWSKGTFPFKVASWATPIKNHLEHCIFTQTYYRCKVHYLLCPSAHQNPLFLATQVVFSLEERVPFRRLKHKIIREISRDQTVKGIRITCSGRVAARSKKAQKARTESIQWGQTSLHVFSDFVHFASRSARTGFGKIGVKVWICYRY